MKYDYAVGCSFTDRTSGPGTGRTITVPNASSITVAVSKAIREFWKSLNTKELNDAASTLVIKVTRTEAGATPAGAVEASA